MTLADAFAESRVEGMDTPHDHHVETVLSRLYFRGDEVCKVYKHRKADFADLTHHETRRTYVREDFEWNQCMSPQVYLELRGVKRDGEMYLHTDPDDAEDWYQVMRRIDTSRDLPHMLLGGLVRQGELQLYVETLLTRLRELTQERGDALGHVFLRGNTHVQQEMLGTLGWASTATEHISSALLTRIEHVLKEVIRSSAYFQQDVSLSIVIDVNGENILFLPDGVAFIDVMPPKDDWRVHDPLFLVARTGADIRARGQGELVPLLYQSYRDLRGETPVEVCLAYEICALLIQVPYRLMIGETEVSSQYAKVLATTVEELEGILKYSVASDSTQTSQ
jgi:aminoglycoside phosphotransferase family enzyme